MITSGGVRRGVAMTEATTIGVAVPAVEYETHRWRPSRPEHYSKSEVRRQTGEYLSAITAPIARWQPSLSGEITADIDDATQALMAFDRHTRLRLGGQSHARADGGDPPTNRERVEQPDRTTHHLGAATRPRRDR